MNVIKVDSLNIKKFRRFENISIEFGRHVTLIAGQNGTSKSTLLGMLAQPFSFGVVRGKTAKQADNSRYTENYHGLKLHEYTDLADKPFMYDCDDVFRLSKQYDFGKDYQYETRLDFPSGTSFTLDGNTLLTKSRPRKNKGKISGMRFVTGPGASHESGEGNFPHPVLYLGLNRLWPLAVTKKCTFSADALSDEDRKWYVKKYNEILCLEEHANKAKFMDTAEKKRFITPESSNYDGESCSAGQDNLSQILTAIMSFKGLKKKIGSRYQGGILLIDELDATLHAYAQEKLLELLCNSSDELGLQTVATSHSLFLLEKAYQSPMKRHISLVHLAHCDGTVITEKFSTFKEVCDHIKVEVTQPESRRVSKVSVLFEDNQGKSFFQCICGSKLRNYVLWANTDALGAGQLKNLANMSGSLPALKDMIFIPDGDMAEMWRKPPNNILSLPGNSRPETLIYRHLFKMKDTDPFWKECASTYTRQVAITREGGDSLAKGDDKDWVKNWYKKQSKHWGRGNQKVFKSWVKAHKAECKTFCEKFFRLLRARYKGDIPKTLTDKILAEFKGS